jgi:hypothetical protein
MKPIRLKYSVDGQISNMFNKQVRKSWINFKNLLPEDIEALKKISKPLVRDNEIALSTDKPSTWDAPNTAPIVRALEYLHSTGHYLMPSIEDMMKELKLGLKNVVTQDEMKSAKASIDELWMEFIKRLDDPEMQSLVKSISPYYMGDSTYGWKLALNNAMKIKKDMPSATFVKTSKQWQDEYNRSINDDAQPLVILVPKDKTVHQVKDVMNKVGYKSGTRYSDLSPQQKDYIKVSARAGDAEGGYKYVKVFDVSQTTVREGFEDLFNSTAGFKNNLTGELNDVAVQDKMKNGYGSKEAVDAIYHNENGNVMLITKALYNSLAQNYPDIKVYCPKDGAPEEDFERAFQDMVMKIADKLIEEKAKIVRAENRRVGIQSTLTAVLILTRLNPQKVASDIASSDFSPKFYFELRDIINEIVSMINKNLPRQESKNNMNEAQIPYIQSVEELMSMLGVEDSVENMEECYTKKQEKINQIKESFYNTLKRI